MKKILWILSCCFLYAQNAENAPILEKPKVIEQPNPYKSLEKIFPNEYIEGVMKGFIESIEKVLLQIDIRKISLDFSNTSINAGDEYIQENINQFNTDNTMIVNFNADLALAYNFESSRLQSRLLMEYGLIVLKPRSAPINKTETLDNIILSLGYTRKAFLLENGFIGPFIEEEYQSEFTKNNGIRTNALRYKAGIRMLDGKYLDEIYLSGVGEIDLSGQQPNIRGALETGLRAKVPITERIDMVAQGFYRQYIGYTTYRNRDLLYNANVSLRVDVEIYNGFAFSPFISSTFAKMQGSKRHAVNLTAGIALLYSNSINAISSIKATQNENLKQYFKSIDR